MYVRVCCDIKLLLVDAVFLFMLYRMSSDRWKSCELKVIEGNVWVELMNCCIAVKIWRASTATSCHVRCLVRSLRSSVASWRPSSTRRSQFPAPSSGELLYPNLFLAAEQRVVGWRGRPITAKQQSVARSVSQSLHMSAILVSCCYLRRPVCQPPCYYHNFCNKRLISDNRWPVVERETGVFSSELPKT